MIGKKSSLSRREFLKAAGLGVAAAGLSTVVPQTMVAQAAPMPSVRRAPKAQAKEITVLVVGDPFQFALDKVKDDFTAQTGITVKLENLAYDALQARLVTSFVSQTPDADVVTVDCMWLGQYRDNNWIIPLDSYIQADKDTDIEDFIPAVLYSLNTWRGHVATLPVAAYGQGVMYRTDVFQKAGLDAPPADPAKATGWTWDKYLETLKKFQGMDMDGTKMFGTVVCGSQPAPIVHMYTQLAASRGVQWFKQFPAAPWDFTPTINSPENVDSLKYYNDLYQLSPAEAINYVWFDAGTRFSKGDIAMFYWWTPYFYLVKNDGYMTTTPSSIVDKYAIGLLPKLSDTAPQAISNGGWSLGIPSSSAAQDEGWQFIKWACSAATQKKMGLVKDWNYQFSDFARMSLYKDEELKKIYPYLDVQLGIMSQGNGKFSRPPCPIYSTLEGIYGLQLNKVLAGAATAEDSLKETDALFTNALKGNMMIPYQLPSYDDTMENTQKLIASLAGK